MEDDAMNQPAMITISEAVKMRGITMKIIVVYHILLLTVFNR